MSDFPAMIYHFSLGQKIIDTPSELEAHQAEGWRTAPFENTEETIKKKIEWHEKEIKDLKADLALHTNAVNPDLPEARYCEEGDDPVDVSEFRQKRKYTRRVK